MNNKLSLISRIVFIVALLAAGLAIFERLAYAMGYTFLRGTISGGRLLEISAILVIFVIALLLREIRDVLRAQRQ
jgi:Mn2+/Fe2+ NRAMP family transporter